MASAADAAVLNERHRGRERHHRDLDVAGDQRRVDLRVAAERHREDVDAGRVLDHLHGQVQRIADAARSVVELAGIGLGLGDQLLHRGDAGFRARHQDEVGGDELRHRREVVDRVERQAVVERGRDGGAVGVLQDGVAIRRRFRDLVGGERAAGAGAILDDRPAGRPGRTACRRAAAPARPPRRRRRTARSAGSDDWDRSGRARRSRPASERIRVQCQAVA